jgi:hypothetical protein
MSQFSVDKQRMPPVDSTLTTHNEQLASFLAMNLFTSSVVMSICALSDTMSDIAQEAKRGMSRTLHLLKRLSTRASLPMQCSTILEDLVGLILKREKAAMLFGPDEGLGTSLRGKEGLGYTQRHDLDLGISTRVDQATGGDRDQAYLAATSRAQTAYRSRAGSYSHPQAQTIFDLQRSKCLLLLFPFLMLIPSKEGSKESHPN